MFLLILKSSACLAIFMIFYRLFLEKENMHLFKRFYLLGALIISIIIPLITLTQHVEAANTGNIIPLDALELNENNLDESNFLKDYAATILCTIYIIGCIALTIRFGRNLRGIILKIISNPKRKFYSFTNVLLQDLIFPHTFLNYIFVNKCKYENNLIPNEVLIHEQTHAAQKHTLDIVFIEILQIVFWFNPLIYLIKKDIKLNHEFLADKAVLKQGIATSQYKETLLAFSSNAKQPELANAINYSSIKKRFTVMKTQTSKQAFWFRSLILLPILAILIYSFSSKKIVEKEINSTIKSTTNISKNSNIINRNDLQNTNNYKEHLIKNKQQQATKEQIAEYNTWAKTINKQIAAAKKEVEPYPIIKMKEVEKYKYIYSIMSENQRKLSEPFPKIAPPPTEAPKPIKIEVKEIPAPSKQSTERKLSKSKVIEIREVPPPPPPTSAISPNSKPSKELLTIQNKYKNQAEKYSKEINRYLKGSNVTSLHLKEMYRRTMVLYNVYQELVKKEEMDIMPPPPPPTAKKKE